MNARVRMEAAAALRALDLIDARESLHSFCGLIQIPGAPAEEDDEGDELGEDAEGRPLFGADAETPAYKPVVTPQAAHHKLLIDVLEAVESGAVPRAMFFLPPGSAKSTYGSVVFPAWFMGRKKRRNVIVATYASDLARKIGRRCRSIIRQRAYTDVFGLEVSADVSAADNWTLTNENEFMGGGILSGITGNRADLIVIDDPIKGRADAESETIRNRTRGEFDDSLRTRLKPGGRIVIIQTRWHEEDLAGGLLPDDYDGRTGWIYCRDGQWWYIVNVPAQAERADDPLGREVGEYLWPEWFSEEHWQQFKRNARTWSALFQQRPAPASGTYFRREWFARRWETLPPGLKLRVYMSSDHAPGGADDSDFNVLRVWGLGSDGSVYMLDGWRGQARMDEVAEQAAILLRRWKAKGSPVMVWFPEDDNNWKAAAPFIKKHLKRTRDDAGNPVTPVWVRIEPISPHGADKEVKAMGFQAMAGQGRVVLPAGPVGDEIIDQYVKFPAGAHDDEIDAAGTFGRALEMAHAAFEAKEREPETRKRYQKKPAKPSGWGV